MGDSFYMFKVGSLRLCHSITPTFNQNIQFIVHDFNLKPINEASFQSLGVFACMTWIPDGYGTPRILVNKI